jgi:hypothetical protein
MYHWYIPKTTIYQCALAAIQSYESIILPFVLLDARHHVCAHLRNRDGNAVVIAAISRVFELSSPA